MKFLYDEMSWPEVKQAVKDDRLAILPVGTCEQHGPHLPLRTDFFVCYEVCKKVGQELPTDVVVLPPVNYGYNEHHLDFPGTIHIDHETFTRFLICIGKSLAYHGFKRIFIVNGHGSNTALCEFASKRITLETNAMCASAIYLAFGWDKVREILEAETSHACELETSLMLHLASELVDMSKAVRDVSYPESKYIRYGWSPKYKTLAIAGGNVQFIDWWSRLSKTGTMGDPTKATKEKGKKIFDAIVNDMVEFIKEFKSREAPPRKDHH
jgi:creatinine amidohydrolase